MMKFRPQKLICVLLASLFLLSAGCHNESGIKIDSSVTQETTEPIQEIQAELGQEAEYGGMKMTVLSVRDPEIVMEQSGKLAMFFEVQLDNQTDETVTANYLNNFSITVDGVHYDSNECCTIPVMKKLYDFYGVDAMNEEIPAGESREGMIACEVNSDFKELSLHYTPKTTDKSSRITVPVTKESIIKAEK